MSALHQLPKPTPARSPSRARRSNQQSRQKKQQSIYRALVIESYAKISVNMGVSVVALITLSHLVPYRMAQQEKLKEIQAEVHTTEVRVSQLQDNFDRVFDPAQAKTVVEEQTHFVDPNQRAVVFDDRLPSTPQKVANLPGN